MKPDWKDAPEWAKYLAMDGDGEWYWYAKEPIAGRSVWIPKANERHAAADGPNWRDSLESRPNE